MAQGRKAEKNMIRLTYLLIFCIRNQQKAIFKNTLQSNKTNMKVMECYATHSRLWRAVIYVKE